MGRKSPYQKRPFIVGKRIFLALISRKKYSKQTHGWLETNRSHGKPQQVLLVGSRGRTHQARGLQRIRKRKARLPTEKGFSVRTTRDRLLRTRFQDLARNKLERFVDSFVAHCLLMSGSNPNEWIGSGVITSGVHPSTEEGSGARSAEPLEGNGGRCERSHAN